ncbi:hypothetical protein Bhyg_06054 [Pseudolycoriella hygida]|uniref:Nucleolar protein 11 n=1 Tax=Pseudolycoriella hygida TaxID=35572 RepID=A0A9Q0N041_9DIPT|nr:hypothetical protein Bhyg_06054 [Pseudolycoriella hygida]
MSKFLSFFNICSISNNIDNFGVSPDSVSGSIIHTLDQNIVIRKELSSLREVQSWTIEELKLSHKVVYDFKSKKYVGVFNKYLICWDEGDQQIKKGKIKLPRAVEDIISLEDKHTILVYKDGTCESLENCSTPRDTNWTPVGDEQTHQINKIACFNVPGDRIMMTYFLRDRSTGEMEFVYFLLNVDTLTPTDTIHRVKIGRPECKLSAFIAVEGDTFPSVVTIWSDERIFVLTINPDESAPSSLGKFVGMFKCLRVNKPMTVVAVGKNCIAIYGGVTQQDGASLILYNTRITHQIVLCRQNFKVYFDNCRLWVIGKYLLMGAGQRLSCLPFRISPEKLSDIIGSKRSIELSPNSFIGTVIKDRINEEKELEEYVTFSGEMAKFDSSVTSNENDVLMKYEMVTQNRFNDPIEIPEVYLNHMRWLYSRNVDVDVVQNESLSQLIKTKTVVHPKDRVFYTEEITVLTEALEECGKSDTEITEHVIPLLIKANLPDELAICLRKYTNISEQMLAKSLQFFIKLRESDTKSALINRVLACSFNKDLIKDHFRTNLSLDNAIYLLEHIHRLLSTEQIEDSPQYGDDFDSDTFLINWFTALLEAHYQQFLLARDRALSDKILKWKTLIDSFVSGILNMKPVASRLTSLVNGTATATLNENAGSKWYTVEVVKLY